MIKPDIEALGVQERVLLFCLASRTDWKQAGVTLKTVAGMWANAGNDPRNYLIRTRSSSVPNALPGGTLALTDAGRAALRALLREL